MGASCSGCACGKQSIEGPDAHHRNTFPREGSEEMTADTSTLDEIEDMVESQPNRDARNRKGKRKKESLEELMHIARESKTEYFFKVDEIVPIYTKVHQSAQQNNSLRKLFTHASGGENGVVDTEEKLGLLVRKTIWLCLKVKNIKKDAKNVAKPDKTVTDPITTQIMRRLVEESDNGRQWRLTYQQFNDEFIWYLVWGIIHASDETMPPTDEDS